MEVKTAIENRKSAFFSVYKIEDAATKQKIDALFKKITEFGNSCKDYADFETKFAASPLNQAYIDLFTEIATTHQPIAQPASTSDPSVQKSDAEAYAESALDDLRVEAKSATDPLRHAAYEANKEALRSTDLGNALFDANNHLETLTHLKKVFTKNPKK